MAENSRRGVSLKNHINISLKQIQLRLSQKNYVRKVNENQIIFCHGPAGTSKTFTACYIGLKMFAAGEIKKIVLSTGWNIKLWRVILIIFEIVDFPEPCPPESPIIIVLFFL